MSCHVLAHQPYALQEHMRQQPVSALVLHPEDLYTLMNYILILSHDREQYCLLPMC